MWCQTKICSSAAAFLLIAFFTGCGRKPEPLFLVQNAPTGHGKKQTIKEAFGRYRYFGNVGWNGFNNAAGTDIVVSVRLDIKRMLSEIKDRAKTEQDREHIAKYAVQYKQYLIMATYDFTFHVSADNTITYTGAAMTESDGNNSVTRQAASEERAQMIQDVYKNAFPTWVEKAIRVKYP
jgi:hypothetical protein